MELSRRAGNMTNCHENHSIIEKVLNKKQISIPNHTAIQTEAHLYLTSPCFVFIAPSVFQLNVVVVVVQEAATL